MWKSTRRVAIVRHKGKAPTCSLLFASPWLSRGRHARQGAGEQEGKDKKWRRTTTWGGCLCVRGLGGWVGVGVGLGMAGPNMGQRGVFLLLIWTPIEKDENPPGQPPTPHDKTLAASRGGGAWVSVGRGREVGLGVTPPSCNAQRSRRRGLKTDSKRGACPTPRTFFFHTTWVHQAPPCTPWPRSSR